MRQKIFLTGATGYLGHQLAITLAGMGNTIHALVRDARSPRIPIHPNILLFQGDLTDPRSIVTAIRGCDSAYHAAALVSFYARPSTLFYRVNVEGTRNVLEAALENKIGKLVFTSSGGVLGRSLNLPLCESDPRVSPFNNDYELSKFLAEDLVREYSQKGLHALIVSPSRVYGPGIQTHAYSVNTVVSRFLRKKMTFIPRPGSLQANYSFIDDVVRGHILAMEHGTSGERYILGGENMSYNRFFSILSRLSGVNPPVIEVPLRLARLWTAAQTEWKKFCGKEIFYSAGSVRSVYCDKAYSHCKAASQLGYRHTDFEDAMRQTIQYLQK